MATESLTRAGTAPEPLRGDTLVAAEPVSVPIARRRQAPAMGRPREEVASLLAMHPVSAGLAPEALRRLGEGASVVRAGRGDVILAQGAPVEHFYALVFGQVQLHVGGKATERRVLGLFGPGDTFGEDAMFIGAGCPASAQASADCLMLRITREALERAMAADFTLAHRMLERMGGRLYGLVCDIEQYTLHSAEQRIANFLHELHERAGCAGQVELGATKRVVASRLALQPETLSRGLHRLQEAGIIRVDHSRVVILDPGALRRRAARSGPA